MSQQWDPFDRPQPLLSCLLHEAILVQAWKKAHAYIRTRNWYADVLELDLSAANLKTEIERWRAACEESGLDALRPEPMWLVPAPKSGDWHFGLDLEKRRRWQPKWKKAEDGKREYQVLRPLAHLTIRDQTFATAAMICLADLVEGAQGDCSLETCKARERGVSSYGNRLYCEWQHGSRTNQPDRASFGWGNANSYRKYYADYKAFLLRPRQVCEEHEPMLQISEELGVISLDLASFYDRIRPARVVKALRRLCKRNSVRSDREFWLALEQIMAWTWVEDSVPVDNLLRDGKRPNGLPQGLVASGFLSNAYMLDFDSALRSAIKDNSYDLPFQVLDYCRYVDDMRVVVRWNASALNEVALQADCTKWFEALLKSHAPGQRCNPDKTKYVAYRDLRSRGSRAVTMEWIQHQLSGPTDQEVLEAAALTLDSLLQAAKCTERALPDWALQDDAPPLARIAHVTEDVRDDTMQRFATYRQMLTLRELRQRAAEDVGVESHLEVQRLDAAMEIAARQWIQLWSEDPSLGIVLRHGMNLMPSPELLRPVLVALRGWIGMTPSTPTEMIAHWVCLYCAADLLRAGAVETGVGVAAEAMPAKSDLAGYRELLAEFAEWVLDPTSISTAPWYLKQQAMLLLICLGRPLTVMRQQADSTTQDYLDLANVSQGVLDGIENSASRIAPLLLVANQFRGDSRLTVSRFARWLAEQDEQVAAAVAEQVYLFDAELFSQLMEHTNGVTEHAAWRGLLADSSGWVVRARVAKSRLPRRRQVPLSTVVAAEPNPFGQENAALRLLVGLIDLLNSQRNGSDLEALTPHTVHVSCANWSRLQDPRFTEEDTALKVTTLPSNAKDPRYRLPDWCPAKRRTFMVVGRLLRAAVTGKEDWTASHMTPTELAETYHGIRSSWYKRQHGMFHRPDALGGPQASCSPWIAELLAKLLMWPGCRETDRLIHRWDAVRTLADLRSLASDRLANQARVYAKASDLPVYVHPVGVTLKDPSKLTVVLVQCVRPLRDDFAKYGTRLDKAGYRTIRRSHLSSLLRVADKLLSLRETYGGRTRADLVLLPELSVHENDMDLIRSLVDRTQAMVFCGLMFRTLPGAQKLVNTARWIIPDRQQTGRSIVFIDQGKQHLTKAEEQLGVSSWRPHQVVIELQNDDGTCQYRMSGSVCLDATDLRLAADLRDLTDLFAVAAHNRDVETFDTMAGALNYHMYQHVAIVNNGEFGGTVVRAPYAERHERVLTHNHGGSHAVVSIVDLDLGDYRSPPKGPSRPLKTPPAGYCRHRADENGELGA